MGSAHYVIPHFKNYPLHLGKEKAFLILTDIVTYLIAKAHFDKETLVKIIKLAYSMNDTTNRNLKRMQELIEFIGAEDNNIEINTPELTDHPLDPHFLMGLIEGDGSFNITFHPNRELDFNFHIGQHSSYRHLLEKVSHLLGCGKVKSKSETEIRYQIDSINKINEILVPLWRFSFCQSYTFCYI